MATPHKLPAVPHPAVFDIGANLTHASFHADLPEVLARARHAGVEICRAFLDNVNLLAVRARVPTLSIDESLNRLCSIR